MFVCVIRWRKKTCFDAEITGIYLAPGVGRMVLIPFCYSTEYIFFFLLGSHHFQEKFTDQMCLYILPGKLFWTYFFFPWQVDTLGFQLWWKQINNSKSVGRKTTAIEKRSPNKQTKKKSRNNGLLIWNKCYVMLKQIWVL